MLQESRYYCPECDDGYDHPEPSRRSFLRLLGGAAAVTAAAGAVGGKLRAEDAPKKEAKPAEALIRELYTGLTADQKKNVVLPYDHMEGGKATRLRTFNAPALGKRIADSYTPAQQEQVQRILKAIAGGGNETWGRISRGGTWDASKSFGGCGALLFGDPAEGQKFAWLFAGHHITLRCDGDSAPGAVFGGPIYYGHSPNGYSDKNVFNYQTQKVQAVFDALNEKQREKAFAKDDEEDSDAINPIPGIAYAELTTEQKTLVETVMKSLLDPFRAADAAEAMQVVKAGGGMDKIHVAFYKDDANNAKQPWHFWRVEGPGFVWNYRVLPHVHCFVNIASA